MNRKHSRTLEAIFANPVSATIKWPEIESLLVAIGCEVIEGNGSRVKFISKGRCWRFTALTRARKPRNIRFAPCVNS
ncbi:type II toxin-antitoxin system HicA family toxin [Komagataeibacter rhaeticus]|nr:type II toxin-antitoxin system HicA family toxin [Komagataeibacter rhaeticus]